MRAEQVTVDVGAWTTVDVVNYRASGTVIRNTGSVSVSICFGSELDQDGATIPLPPGGTLTVPRGANGSTSVWALAAAAGAAVTCYGL